VKWTVAEAGPTVAAFVKASSGEPWSRVKRLITTGKVFVDGVAVTAVDARVVVGQVVEVRLAAPRPRDPMREATIVYDDGHVVVIDKPPGVSSVPYDDRETGTAMDLIRGAWRRMGKPATEVPLHVVHRIDKATSGLLAFATTKRAELGLAAQLRDHTVERAYACVAHGEIRTRTIESRLVADRGDGLRGSTRHSNQHG
jgi:23S rRNA pseudouridine1911/1915/1917 synthase